MGTNSLENMLACSKPQQDRKPRPQPEQALKCPRCESTNTKFCYYNNYSLTQPRYFCKSCRRYWTKGGTLRNVPVGGGCRKNKRSSSSSSSSKNSKAHDHHQPFINPNANPSLTAIPSLNYLGYDDHEHGHHHHEFPNLGSTHGGISPQFDIFGNPSNLIPQFDAIRSGFLDTQNTHFQNLYYGYNGDENMGDQADESNGHDNGVSNGEMLNLPSYGEVLSGGAGGGNNGSNAATTAVTVTTMKQEMCDNRSSELNSNNNNNSGRVLWGFPWQMNGDGGNNMMVGSEIDAGKGSWNGLTSTWHGLLNSPLM